MHAGCGADELIDILMRCVLEPGDAILNCPPTFGMYAFDADVNDARVIDVPRRADFSVDVAAVAAAVAAHRPKILFLTSPNNPDGAGGSSADPPQILRSSCADPAQILRRCCADPPQIFRALPNPQNAPSVSFTGRISGPARLLPPLCSLCRTQHQPCLALSH